MTADICVIVPTLGERPELLDASVRSIRASGPNAAVVVVAPPDRCAELDPIVNRAGAHLIAQNGKGQSAAINQGWAEFGNSSRFLTWLGDDDLLEPQALELATAALIASPTASMVVGTVRYIDLDGRMLFLFRPPPMYGAWLMRYGHNLMSQPGSLLRRTSVDAAGPLDETLRFAMDLDLFLRLAQCGPIVRVDDVLASFRWHANSLTAGQGDASEREAESVRQRYWSHPRVDPFLRRGAKAVTQLQYWWAKR